jgi:hypothetical protein
MLGQLRTFDLAVAVASGAVIGVALVRPRHSPEAASSRTMKKRA